MRFLFEYLHKLIRSIYNLSFKEHRKAWIGLSILIILCLSQITNLRFLVMMSDLLDHDFTTYSEYTALNKDFVEESQVSVMISSNRGELSLDDHRLILLWLSKIHLKQHRIARIYSSYGLREGVERDKSFELKPVLIPDYDGDYSSDEIKVQLNQVLNSPSGIVLTNKKNDDVFASFYLHNLSKEEGDIFGHFNTVAFELLTKSFETEIQNNAPHIQATWIGIGTYQYYLQKAYEQMNLVNLITGLILLLSFRLFIGRWKSGAILLGTYSVSLTILYGLMAIFKYPVDSLSAAVPIMLLISTLEDFVFFLLVHSKTKDIKKSFEKILIPSFYTSLTTCVGFLSLYLSELSIIRRFGLICAMGAIIEWIVVFTILPKLLVLWENHRKRDLDLYNIPRWIEQIDSFFSNIRPKRVVGILFLFPLLYLVFNNSELRIDDSPEAVFPKSHIIRSSTDKLLKERGWKSEVSLVFPDSHSRVEQEFLSKAIVDLVPEFVDYESFYRVKEHIKTPLKNRYSKNFVENNFELSEISERWISPESAAERTLIYSSTTDVVRMNEIRKDVHRLCGDQCYLANILVSYSEFGVKVLRTLTDSFSISIIVIISLVLTLCWYFRIKNFIALTLSALWGPLTLMFLIIYFDIGIYFVTSVVMSVLVGLAGDNGLHFIFARNKENEILSGVDLMSKATLLSMFLMIICAGSFLFSDFDGVRKIGMILCVGFFLGWVGDVLLLKSLVKKS